MIIVISASEIINHLRFHIRDFGVEETIVYLFQQNQILSILNFFVDSLSTIEEMDKQFQFNFEELIKNDAFVEIDENMYDQISYAINVIATYIHRFVIAYALVGRLSVIEVTSGHDPIMYVKFDHINALSMDYNFFYKLARSEVDIYGNPLILSSDWS